MTRSQKEVEQDSFYFLLSVLVDAAYKTINSVCTESYFEPSNILSINTIYKFS